MYTHFYDLVIIIIIIIIYVFIPRIWVIDTVEKAKKMMLVG